MNNKELKFVCQRMLQLIIGLFLSGLMIAGISCKKEEDSSVKPATEPYTRKAYIIQLSNETTPSLPDNFDELARFNFFGVCWGTKVDDNLKFVKQMGYTYVMYQSGMENSYYATDLNFYLETPEYQVYSSLNVDIQLIIAKAYSESQKNTYQTYFALKNTSLAFPDNMAGGYPRTGSMAVQPDWQQQKVIDYFVSQIKSFAKKKEKADKKFLFGGLAWDVPQFAGDFWADGKQVTLSYWNVKDSSALFFGCTHEYKTYSAARVAFYLALKEVFKAEYPERRLKYIFEPYQFYEYWFKDVEKLDSERKIKLMEDAFVTQESGIRPWSSGTEFVDDLRAYKTGLASKDHSGSTTPDNHDLNSNKIIAGKAAVNGAWFNWYGRFSGSGDNAPMNNIYEVPSWLQLIRVVGNWDNLNGVPLANRKWEGFVYTSSNSRIDDNIIYSRQPKTQKLFVVFLNDSGEISLNPGEKIVSVMRVDSLFRETVDGSRDILINGNTIRHISK
jgi:hypothetical protein